jgi:hypothetical protein
MGSGVEVVLGTTPKRLRYQGAFVADMIYPHSAPAWAEIGLS